MANGTSKTRPKRESYPLLELPDGVMVIPSDLFGELTGTQQLELQPRRATWFSTSSTSVAAVACSAAT